MKSGGPWNLRGLRPEARAAAREAARASGLSVGEWLNNVIQPADEPDDEARWSDDFDREPNDRQKPRTRDDESGGRDGIATRRPGTLADPEREDEDRRRASATMSGSRDITVTRRRCRNGIANRR